MSSISDLALQVVQLSTRTPGLGIDRALRMERLECRFGKAGNLDAVSYPLTSGFQAKRKILSLLSGYIIAGSS